MELRGAEAQPVEGWFRGARFHRTAGLQGGLSQSGSPCSAPQVGPAIPGMGNGATIHTVAPPPWGRLGAAG